MGKSKKTTKKQSEPSKALSEQPKAANKKQSRTILTISIFLLVVVVLVVFGYIVRSRTIAAMINGIAIRRSDVIDQLEKTQGKQILESLLNKELILQEAKKQNITVSDEEINTELDKIKTQLEAQGQNLESIMAMQGLTLDQVKTEIKIQKLIEKLVLTSISITDEEISSFIEQNKEYLPESTDEAKLKEQVREQIKTQKLSTEAQSLLETLRKSASIQYFGVYVVSPTLVPQT
jgi:foldase protein PrsA